MTEIKESYTYRKGIKHPTSGEDIICWWSGGVDSAVACFRAINLFGLDRCRFIMIDTNNEDDDTYRFMIDCESWYGKMIERISSSKWDSIQDVWNHFNSLNVATGAICSTELKRSVRETWQKHNPEYTYQVFGFDIDEPKRGKALTLNYPGSKPIYPNLMFATGKNANMKMLSDAAIVPPRMYQLGFKNNNCFKTGCVQGGIGYWQKMQREFPDKFEKMASLEHALTKRGGKPVTCNKDQSKEAKRTGNVLVFLKKHPDYPHLKSIDEMPACEVLPVFECNGFCGTNDLNN